MDTNLIEHLEFAAADLVYRYPSQFHDPNKKMVYGISSPPGAEHNGTIRYTRWSALPLPKTASITPVVSSPGPIQVQENFYDYAPLISDRPAMEWHVNFADPFLFTAYNSGLFAQDEMQVAEHPALGSLAEALSTGNARRFTVDKDQPTPILISGVERRCSIATEPNESELRPYGLYGNMFSAAPAEAVLRAAKPIQPPSITNLIAMAAPGGGYGRYSEADITNVLTTAFTSFNAAAAETAENVGASAMTVVHTGFWGCGAFGGNRHVMTMLQIIAAQLANIDRLVFHSADSAGSTTVQEAIELLDQEVSGHDFANTNELIMHIESLGLEWGESDGN